jgi:hypothetical protein
MAENRIQSSKAHIEIPAPLMHPQMPSGEAGTQRPPNTTPTARSPSGYRACGVRLTCARPLRRQEHERLVANPFHVCYATAEISGHLPAVRGRLGPASTWAARPSPRPAPGTAAQEHQCPTS